MRNKVLLLVGSAMLSASPAYAAGFTGPRAEVRGGWDRTTIDIDYDDGVDAFSDDGSDSGLNIGAELGFDFPIGTGAVAGVYGGVEWANTKECGEIYGDDEACLKLGRSFTLGGRIGAIISPRALIYVKGGYSNGQIKATYEDFIDSDFNFSDSANRDGYHLGLGGELSLSNNVYARAEYVRTNYNDYDYSDEDVDVKVDSHRDQLLVGVGFRF